MWRAQQLARQFARKRCRAVFTSPSTPRLCRGSSAYTQHASGDDEPRDYLHDRPAKPVEPEEEENTRDLFHTLRAFSTVMPSQLANTATERSSTAALDLPEEVHTCASIEPLDDEWIQESIDDTLHDHDETLLDDPGSAGYDELPSTIARSTTEQGISDDGKSPTEIIPHHDNNNPQPLQPLDGPLLGNAVTVAAEISPSSEESKARKRQLAEQIRLLESIEHRLFDAIIAQNLDVAINLFEAAVSMDCKVPIRLDLVKELFFFMTKSKPFHSYQILQYYKQRARNLDESKVDPIRDKQHNIHYAYITGDKMMMSFYHRMCDSLRHLDPEKNRHMDAKNLVQSVILELEQQDEAVQHKCYPMLVSALAAQRTASIGPWSAQFYHYMLYSPQAKHFEKYMTPSYFLHLLAQSKYNRPQDLPYHDIMRRVVEAGQRPVPHVILNALENLFPYVENIEATYTALKAVYQLQKESIKLFSAAQSQEPQPRQQVSEENPKYNKDDDTIHSYVVDISTLEYIAAAAARTGCCELNFLIWDVLEVMGLDPTESIYESTIICFAQHPQFAENAFAVLWDMEEKGFTATLPLIRQFGTSLRADEGSMDTAEQMLEAFQLGTGEFSPTSLNVFMSAYAERGDVENTIPLLDEFQRMEWTPTADSFSFALEAVGKAAGRMTNNRNLRISDERRQSLIISWTHATDRILTMFEEAQAENPNMYATSHVIRNYVEFLCHVDQVATASQLVFDLLGRGERSAVDNKTLFRVAVANANIGDFEVARKLAQETTEPMPFITQKIDQIYEQSMSAQSEREYESDDDPET